MSIHAIIVGINAYKPPFVPLVSAVGDAYKIEEVLKSKLGAIETNITVLEDATATKDQIIESISSLSGKAVRDDTIIFFFSGYAGKTQQGKGEVGVLCPVDVSKEGGISDETLLQAFDQVAKSCGNNITLLLDCPAKLFNWKNPTSCVIVAPSDANENEHGGVFTQAVISVLKTKSLPMTVLSFSGHVQAAMDDVEVLCVGSKVNHLLFDPNGRKGHHAFIPGRTSRDGKILLSAGAAHGVRVGTIYGIYPSNIERNPKSLGQLRVVALNMDDITATLASSNGGVTVPPFFYAVEEHNYFSDVSILVPESLNFLHNHRGWAPPPLSSKPTIKVNEVNGRLHFIWNGLTTDPTIERTDSDVRILKPANNSKKIQAEIIRIARFHSLLDAETAANSTFSDGLRVLFQEVDPDNREPKGHNLFENESDSFGNKVIKLNLKKEKRIGPCSLTIINNNPFAVWPYILLFDTDGFEIYAWYLPPPGTLDSPLAAKSKFVVGCDHGDIIFRQQLDRDYDFLYLKIFVTRDRTDFAFFTQRSHWTRSRMMEDDVRGIISQAEKSQEHNRTDVNSETTQSRRYLTKIDRWASMRITILQMHHQPGEEENLVVPGIQSKGLA